MGSFVSHRGLHAFRSRHRLDGSSPDVLPILWEEAPIERGGPNQVRSGFQRVETKSVLGSQFPVTPFLGPWSGLPRYATAPFWSLSFRRKRRSKIPHLTGLGVPFSVCFNFWVWSESVLANVAFCCGEAQEDQWTHHRHEIDEQPPTTAIGVVQPPNNSRKRRDNHRHYIKRRQDAKVVAVDDFADINQNHDDREMRQFKNPILFSTSPASEDRVLSQRLEIPSHDAPTLHLLWNEVSVNLIDTCRSKKLMLFPSPSMRRPVSV